MNFKSIFISVHTVEGFSGPFEALLDELISRKVASLEVIEFPLLNNFQNTIRRRTWTDGILDNDDQKRTLLMPPLSYIRDAFLRPKRNPDLWISFDSLLGLRSTLGARNRVSVVWYVDYVPRESFGIRNWVYRKVERWCSAQIDLSIELSPVAKLARSESTGITPRNTMVIPMGVIKPMVAEHQLSRFRKRVVYLGALEERTTGGRLTDLIQALLAFDPEIHFDVIGSGPLKSSMYAELRESKQVTFHGYLSDDRVIEVLNECTIGLAPYSGSVDSFSRFADPGKVKMYLSAGLPIVISDVPAIAQEIGNRGAGLVLPADCSNADWVSAIIQLLQNDELLDSMRQEISSMAQELPWHLLVDRFLEAIHSIQNDC